jgi:predicted GNAT family N-acyltransferase
MEWDEYDETCIHVLAFSNGEPIATGRILDTGQIGRMAVLKEYRNKRVGTKMLEEILDVAVSKNMKMVFLNSQIDAINFYKKFGFVEEGGVFDDAGIPHLKMTKVFIE